MAKSKGNNSENWWQSRQFYGIKIVLDLVIAYTFASLAVDTGSLLAYLFSGVFLGLAVNYALKLLKK